MTAGVVGMLVEYNLITRSGDDGVSVVSYATDATRVSSVIARNNLIRDNVFGRNMSVVGGQNVLYSNNYIDGNTLRAGLYIAQDDAGSLTTKASLNVKAEYNTVRNCGNIAVGHAAIMVVSDGSDTQDGIWLLRNDIVFTTSTDRTGIRYYGPQTNVRLEQNRYGGTGLASEYSGGGTSVTLNTAYSSGLIGYAEVVAAAPAPAPAPAPTPAPAPVAATDTVITDAPQALPLATQWQDKPPAGQALAYANGRIYIAQGEFIFATTALGFEYVDLRDYLSLDGSRVRLLAGVEGGLFAATDIAAYFLRGKTFEAMELTVVSNQGGVAGSVAYVDGARASGIKELAGKRCVVFATGDGVLLGLPDGSVMNLTQERYRFAIDAAGAAVFHETDKLNSYLLFMRP
jgi:hypothetical protein